MTQQEDAMQKAALERDRFNSFAATSPNITSYKFTKGQYSRYDVKMCSATTYYLCEIKNRNYTSAFFSKNKPYIELSKLSAMVCEQKTLIERKKVKTRLLYFNFTKDAQVQIYRLRGVNDYKWELKELPVDDFTPHILVWKLVSELSDAPIETVKVN